MKLIFEQSHPGHRSQFLPASDVPAAALPEELARESALDLPELTEGELARHYEALAQQVHGVNKGFYPLGSCTMKYNPRIDEDAAALPGFTGVHPLQSETTSRGCREVLRQAEERLTAITGMDRMTFQPAAGAHGEYMGLLLIKAYHERRGDKARTKVLVPDSAHGTNPASAAMCGYQVVSIPSDANGLVDLEKLREAAGPDTAAQAVLNANYLMCLLRDGGYPMAYDHPCMHEFVITLEKLKHEKDVSALDVAKALLDHGMHPPTMYFPLIVHEALMVEPTETESKESLEAAAESYLAVLAEANENPADMHNRPLTTYVRRLDEVTAARNPIVKYEAPSA